PRPWATVRAAVRALAATLPPGQFLLVRYIRATQRDADGTSAEAAWPLLAFRAPPFDACGGILALGVADAAGLAAITRRLGGRV
ncbi:hypothetical protein BDR26DRAFT_854746, partial [Obelidium mucronatum]